MRAATAAAAEANAALGAEDNKVAAEDEALKFRMARESRFARLSQNLSATGDIVKLQEEGNSYVRKIEAERVTIAELDAAIAKAHATIIEQKRRMGGVNAAKENHTMIARQIRLFENRLDKSLVKFNESLARNKGLREKIDNLRRERVVFDGVYKKVCSPRS
jgi:predicted RNase H-like nuclease (RuvC/YqgF family)